MLLSAAIASISLSFLFALGGVGAAAALVPVLHALGIALTQARAIGLLVNTLSLSGATYVNIRRGEIRVWEWIPLIGTSLVMAPVGAYVSTTLPEDQLLAGFAVFLIISGTVMMIGKKGGGHRSKLGILSQLGLGVIAGFISGLLGIGSGGLIVPLLGFLGFKSKRIATITALVVPVSSFSGFVAYAQMGHVDIQLASVCGTLALLGGYIGTQFMHTRLSQATVRKLLAVFLIVMAVKTVGDVLLG